MPTLEFRLRLRDNDSMLRDKSLIPLSHQHQHALALCVRIDRAVQAGEVDLAARQEELHQVFVQEIRTHFEAEETHLFPAAARLAELRLLVGELRDEHALLREYFARAANRTLDSAELHTFASKLSAHIRKEERQLFEELQRRLKPGELAALGAALAKALEGATQACTLPHEATRLRQRNPPT